MKTSTKQELLRDLHLHLHFDVDVNIDNREQLKEKHELSNAQFNDLLYELNESYWNAAHYLLDEDNLLEDAIDEVFIDE